MTVDVDGMTAEGGEWAEQLQELYLHISQLGKLERALVFLWLEERSYQEMAEILGISKANVAVKLNRTKEKLRRSFAKESRK